MTVLTTPPPADDGDGQRADTPAVIRPQHKQRLAVVYIRQSTEQQVRHHTGSTEAQRDLAALPRRWGWPESRILTIDDDLGLSGTSSSKRTGFQQLLALMHRSEVGIVLVRDVSRISRNPLDAERFLHAAIRAQVLVEANGRVYDPTSRDLTELFGLRLQGLLAWWENAQRISTFRAAKEARIREGYAVSRPPIGYVRAEKGKWIKDPDQAIRYAVQRVFDLYLELRSIHKVAKKLREE
jgi:DNA invertase Pin-like site-specific DNA recombinase